VSLDEHPLEMTVDQLRDIRHAIDEIGDRPGRYVYPEFVIHHEGS
jgi:hydroxyacylglutathione hydrolase